eukprot:m51a1_g9671 hypothetical protein (186) ;mRNA; r:1265523-1266814
MSKPAPPPRAGAPAPPARPGVPARTAPPPAAGKPAAKPGDKPTITKPSRLIAASKAGEDNLIEEYLTDPTKNLDVNKQDSLGQTALHWACASGYPTTATLLLKHGANPNAQDKEGEFPMHKAAWKGSVECVNVLVGAGAKTDVVNHAGKKPVDLCRVAECRRALLPQAPQFVDEPDTEEPEDDED